VLRSSLNLLAGKLNKSTDNLSVEYGENIPAVEANAQHLTQVAINLILNGIESLSGIGKSLNIKSFYESEKGMVVLEVRDNGSGIEPEQMQKIFKPFFTTKRETGGTGLGLPIARKIAETYGGQILISSCIGEGTTAILELPVCHRGK
jgi:polar amino acid transport system substrate-binding protein